MGIHIMFEDDPQAETIDIHGRYTPPETIIVVDKDVGMDLRPPREFKSYRERNNKSNPDDVFKILLANTLNASKAE